MPIALGAGEPCARLEIRLSHWLEDLFVCGGGFMIYINVYIKIDLISRYLLKTASACTSNATVSSSASVRAKKRALMVRECVSGI
jgi:hypothetical protein